MAFKDKYYKTLVDGFWAYKGKGFLGDYPTLRETFEITLTFSRK